MLHINASLLGNSIIKLSLKMQGPDLVVCVGVWYVSKRRSRALDIFAEELQFKNHQ